MAGDKSGHGATREDLPEDLENYLMDDNKVIIEMFPRKDRAESKLYYYLLCFGSGSETFYLKGSGSVITSPVGSDNRKIREKFNKCQKMQ